MADTRKNAGKTPGRGSGRPFEKGNPGKPKGARHRITVTAEQLLAGGAEALTRRAIEMALGGDAGALRLCLERVMPVRKGRPVKFKMPEVGTASDVVSAIGAVLRLVGRLAPDFKTIADFRKDNGAAIRAVCRQFVGLCRQLGLFTGAVVAIDGSKFKAVNNRDKNYTVAKVIGRMEQVNASIARYLRALDQQVSLTDPDARSMATSGKGTATVGYNVQIAVDAEHHLIVAHEVINQGYDRHQLAPMALKAQQATGCEQVTALADRGYFNGDQVLSCEGTGVAPIVPKTLTSGNTKRGLFTGQDFIYDAEKDHYTCPAGQHLTRGRVRSDRSGEIDQYRHLTACFTCPLKPRCTAEKVKRVKRWKHEGVLDAMQDRLDRMPEAMGVRRQTVEHPFGTLKAWMGATHFLTRTLDKVRTEMSLLVLAYNIKRMITILGVGPLMAAIRT